MAASKKTEVANVDQETGEILPFEMDLEADAASHSTTFAQDQMIIPRITILQDLSPQVKEGKAEHIPGAKPGMIYNSVTGETASEIDFIPAHFETRYMAWKPRKSGGGLVNMNVDPAILTEANGWQQENPGKWIGKMVPQGEDDAITVEVIMAGEWAGVTVNPDGSMIPVAISFPGAKAKICRKINTQIDLKEEKSAKTGKFFKPPSFYHVFTLSAGAEPGPTGEDFMNYVIKKMDIVRNHPFGARAYNKARALDDAIKAGEAAVEEAGEGDH